MNNIQAMWTQADSLCPNERVPYVTGITDEKMLVLRGSCGQWSCEVCGARNGKQWLARLLEGMNKMNEPRWYFVTITAHEKWRGAERSVKNLRQGWKKLYNRMRRKYGISTYCKVWEQHADGTFHLHILIARKIGKRWLKDNARACGLGYQVDSSRSKNPGMVAGYIAKYLLKSIAGASGYPKGMRRIECSRDFPKLEKLEQESYEWIINFTAEEQRRSVIRNRANRQVRDLRPRDHRKKYPL